LSKESTVFSKPRLFGLCACFACVAGAAQAAPASSAPPGPARAPAGYASAPVEAGSGGAPTAAPRLAAIPAPRAWGGSRADGTGLPPLHHMGLVVRDRDRTLANLTDALGFEAISMG